MTLFYLSIPFMLIGITLALAPLLWAMTHGDHVVAAPVRARVPAESLSPVGTYGARAT